MLTFIGRFPRSSAIMIAEGGKRNPAKLDLDAYTRRQRRRIHQACVILLPSAHQSHSQDSRCDQNFRYFVVHGASCVWAARVSRWSGPSIRTMSSMSVVANFWAWTMSAVSPVHRAR